MGAAAGPPAQLLLRVDITRTGVEGVAGKGETGCRVGAVTAVRIVGGLAPLAPVLCAVGVQVPVLAEVEQVALQVARPGIWNIRWLDGCTDCTIHSSYLAGRPGWP